MAMGECEDVVSPAYFETVEIPRLARRDFSNSDNLQSPQVITPKVEKRPMPVKRTDIEAWLSRSVTQLNL